MVYNFIEKNINGWELVSNDGQMKVILRHNSHHTKNGKDSYIAYIFVKDDTEWQQTSDTHNFDSEKEFLKTMFTSDDFSEAYQELEAKKEEFLTKKS